MHKLAGLMSLLTALWMQGCDANQSPTPGQPTVKGKSEGCIADTFANVAYARDKRTRLDVFLPKNPRQHPVPWVLWVHGGGWAGGTRGSVEKFALRQTCRGYAVVTVDYRLSFEAPFPAALSDLRAAVRFMRVHANKYDLHPTNMVIWGASAGAHLASLMALSSHESSFDRPDDRYRKMPIAVRGVIGWWTPSSFTQFDADFDVQCMQHACHTCAGSAESRFVGCEVKKCTQRAERASPLHWVHGNGPPFLLSHGTHDCTVPAAQSTRFAAALQAAGGSVELQIVQGGRHGDGTWLQPEVMAHVDAFLDKQLQAPSLSGLPSSLPVAPASQPAGFVQPSPRSGRNVVR